MRQQGFYAGIQATLHNAHFRHPVHHPEAFTPDMWMPRKGPTPISTQPVEQKMLIIRQMLTGATRRRANG